MNLHYKRFRLSKSGYNLHSKNSNYQDVSGYIIAGGSSRRLGRDKRLIRVKGMTLLDRTAKMMEETLGTAPTLVGDNLQGVSDKNLRIIPDAIPGKGPLGGIVAALQDADTVWIIVLASDMPFLSLDDLIVLLDAPRSGYDVITLTNDGRAEPLAGLYSVSKTAYWESRLETGELALHKGIKQLRWKGVKTVTGQKALLNINYAEDMEKYLETER